MVLDGKSYEILDGPMAGVYVNLAETQQDAVAGRPSECEIWTGQGSTLANANEALVPLDLRV